MFEFLNVNSVFGVLWFSITCQIYCIGPFKKKMLLPIRVDKLRFTLMCEINS